MTDAEAPDIVLLMLTYNHARFLPLALEALLAQTYRNFQLIIVDDDSKDDSFEIAQTYQNRFSHCAVYRNEKNKGAIGNFYESMQKVHQLAPHSKFFMWACADDRWDPDYLEELRMALLVNPDAVIAQTYFDMLHTSDNRITIHHLATIRDHSYAAMKKICHPHVSQAGRANYNNVLHGLIRMSEVPNIYPEERKNLAAALSTEISMLIATVLRGQVIIVPKNSFHKISSGKFADLNPRDELTAYYNNPWQRTWFATTRLPWFLKIRQRNRSILAVLLLWLRVFYFYSVLQFLIKIKKSIRK